MTAQKRGPGLFGQGPIAPFQRTKRRVAVASDWTYGMCPLDTKADKFGPFADLVALWQSRRPEEGGLPRRRDFVAEDFFAWMGRIFIARVEHDPFDLRFTLWGTTLAEWWGVDYTGKTLGEQSEKPASWTLERRYFQAMACDPFIGLAGGYLTQHKRDHIKVIGVDLPFSDGSRVDRVLSAHMRVTLEQDFDAILPDCPRTLFENGGADAARVKKKD